MIITDEDVLIECLQWKVVEILKCGYEYREIDLTGEIFDKVFFLHT